jgi:CRP/FNR family cyclic AMP-dependent transcriptional regulator
MTDFSDDVSASSFDSESSSVAYLVFEPGEIIFHEDERSFHFFIIQEGEVEVFKLAQNGEELLLATVGEGKSLGEFAMIDRLPRSATARAKTTVRVAKISDKAYRKLLEELPDWAMCVMSGLVERLRQTNDRLRRSTSITPALKQDLEAMEYCLDNDSNPFLSTSDSENL